MSRPPRVNIGLRSPRSSPSDIGARCAAQCKVDLESLARHIKIKQCVGAPRKCTIWSCSSAISQHMLIYQDTHPGSRRRHSRRGLHTHRLEGRDLSHSGRDRSRTNNKSGVSIKMKPACPRAGSAWLMAAPKHRERIPAAVVAG